jgi:HK97 gp10 family phage protein
VLLTVAKDPNLSRVLRKMRKAAVTPREKVLPALLESAHELADLQRRFAEQSRDTGNLIASIAVTGPGQQTPAYSQPGGSRVAGENEALVTVGDDLTRYPHLVEYGTAHAEAQPFFWPAYRLLRKRIIGRINRTAKKAVRDAWKGA